MNAQDKKALSDLGALRNWGFSVAIHNDYRQGDERRTFWLFTHPSGRWIKGEGATDGEALTEALKMAWASPVADAVGLRAEMEAERRRANYLAGVLHRLEWSRDDMGRCPACLGVRGEGKGDGHSATCWMAAILRGETP